MKKKNKLLINQNGSISMFVIVSVLFISFVLIGIYASYANKLKAQEEQLGKIQENYGEHTSEDGMDNLYIAQTQPEDDNEDEETGDTDTTPLPAEYQQVEYIQSTGTQYIDTGYYPDSNTNAKYKVSLSSYATYGPHLLSSKNYYFPLLRGDTIHILSKRGTTEFSSAEINPVIDTIYEIEAFWDGKIIINGQEIGTLTNTGGTDTTTLYLGTYGGSPGNAMYTLNGKIYYCKIYNGNILVRDFIPCYRKSDNVIGLYDLVNNVFYTNQGTGTFVKGEDVT